MRLNLGPGDGPYSSGLASGYDIADGTALQWSGEVSRFALPLAFEGPADLRLRFGPPRGGEAQVDLAMDGRPLESFACCERQAFQRHRISTEAPSPTPIEVELRVASPAGDKLGLLLDWVELGLGPDARVFLTGAARFRPSALVAVAAVMLVLLGFGPLATAALVAPLALALAFGLRLDPWLVHRLLTALPESLLAFGAIVLLLARGLRRAGLLGDETARRAPALALLAFVLRAAAVNHPDFYHPDLMSHARRTAVVQRAGYAAFVSPTKYLNAREGSPQAEVGRTAAGLYLYRIGESQFPLPYSLLPYVPVAALGLDYDGAITALKVLGAASCALPIVLVAALARALRAPETAALLLFAAPTAVFELSFASIPALFGHVFDLALLVFLAARLGRLERPRIFLVGTLLLAAAQLAYISATVVMAAFFLVLAGLLLGEGAPAARVRAVLAVLASASFLSVVLYYRDFLRGTFAAVSAALTAPAAALSLGPGSGRVDAALGSWLVPIVLILALAGLPPRLRDAGPGREVLLASFVSALLVALLRLRVPVVFGYVHLALFVTPFVCVLAASGLRRLTELGRLGGYAAAALGLLAFAHGLFLQGQAVFAQLGRAR